MGNVRTDKPHLSLIYVTLTCLFKLSFENGQPGKAIFPLGFQIWKPTGSQRVETLHVQSLLHQRIQLYEDQPVFWRNFCSAFRVDWYTFRLYLSDFSQLFSSL